MAKSAIKSAALSSTVPAATVTTPTELVWGYGTGEKALSFKVPVSDILGADPKVAYYLLQNGFKQSMADSIAGYAKGLKREGLFEKPFDPNSAEIEGGTRTYTDEQVEEMVRAELQDRFAKILSGDVGLGASGPRLRGIDAIMRDVAVERLKASFATNKTLTVPKGENWTKLVQAYIAKNDAALREEADKRQNTVAGTDDVAALMAAIAVAA